MNPEDIIVYYPQDWVMLYDHTGAAVGLCPRSIADNKESLRRFLETGSIPREAPELRRICKVTATPQPSEES